MKRSASNRRRGATVTEVSLTMFMFVLLTLGTIDLGIGVFRYHVLAHAARQAARRAIVHGSRANVLGEWGPTTIDVPATASGIPVVDGATDGIQSMLIGCNLSQTQIRVEWLDGSTQLERRVKVTVSSDYRPVLLGMFGNRTLSASSTMPIAH